MANAAAAGAPPSSSAAAAGGADEAYYPASEIAQLRSDSYFLDHRGWRIARETAPSPTLVAEITGVAPRRVRVWLGPLDVALDLTWLQMLEVGRCTTHKSYIRFILPHIILQCFYPDHPCRHLHRDFNRHPA